MMGKIYNTKKLTCIQKLKDSQISLCHRTKQTANKKR